MVSIIVTVLGAVAVAGGLLYLGYLMGQSEVKHTQGKIAELEAKIELCRQSNKETAVELGNIYQHLQTQDADFQRKLAADMAQVGKEMKDALGTGMMPGRMEPPTHPQVGASFARPLTRKPK